MVGEAKGVIPYWNSLPRQRAASAHRVYDPGTVVQAVEYKNVAWHCSGLNHCGVGFELPGRSANNDWSDPPMEAAMELCAADIVECASVYQIPLTFLDAPALARGERHGITTHWEATKAGVGKNDHTDPGSYFPVGRFLEICKNQHGSTQAPPVADGKFTGGEMGFAPNAGVGSVSVAECKLAGTGFYTLTADGGVRADDGASFPGPPAIASYPGLPPAERQGDRFFTGITPNEDGSPGYTLWSNDGGRFAFGPGKNDWPT